MKMDPEVKRLWVSALRDPERYTQHTRGLYGFVPKGGIGALQLPAELLTAKWATWRRRVPRRRNSMNKREAKKMLLRRLAHDLRVGDAFVSGLCDAKGIRADSDDAARLWEAAEDLVLEFERRGGGDEA